MIKVECSLICTKGGLLLTLTLEQNVYKWVKVYHTREEISHLATKTPLKMMCFY